MKHILLTVLLFAPFGGYAQLQGQARLDSLLAELPDMKEDSAGVRLLTDIAKEFKAIDPAKEMIFSKRLLNLAKSTNNRYGELLGYNLLGDAYLSLSDYPNAYENYLITLSISEEIHDTLNAAGTMLNIGTIFIHQDNYTKALHYFHQALPYAKALANTRMLTYIYGNIARVQLNSDSLEMAEKYAELGLEKAHELGDPVTTQRFEMIIAAVNTRLMRYSLALDAYYRALEFFQENGQRAEIADALSFLGTTYLRIAQDTVTVVHDVRVPHGRQAIAQKSVEFLTKAIALSREQGRSNREEDWQQPLSQAYALAGQHELSLKAFQRYAALKDSLFTTENTTLITNMETKRMVELKEKDIEIARLEVEKKRNERWFFIAGIVLLLGIMGSLFRSFRKQRQANVVITLEKKRSDDLLLNILPAEVAEELMDTGAAAAKHFEQATILFTDFKGFTQASETMTPQDLVAELNTCFAAFDHIITARGIEKIKTIGDAYMCVGGLPDPQSSSPVSVVHAALEMQAFMTSRKAERDAQGLPAFEMRVGIHTGPVVAGIVGVKKFQYDIWGDTVNTASRMESSGEVGQVNISEMTYGLVKTEPGLLFTSRGRVQAKGKGEMEMYFVAVQAPPMEPFGTTR